MLNDILLGRTTAEGEKREVDPFRAPGDVQNITCATCGTTVPASQAAGTRCRRCIQPAPPATPPISEPFCDPALEFQLRRDAERAKGRSDVGFGVALLAIGIVITAVTYSSASHSGGTYIIALGPVIGGVIRLFRGLARLGG
jgi:hypothetical protein